MATTDLASKCKSAMYVSPDLKIMKPYYIVYTVLISLTETCICLIGSLLQFEITVQVRS